MADRVNLTRFLAELNRVTTAKTIATITISKSTVVSDAMTEKQSQIENEKIFCVCFVFGQGSRTPHSKSEFISV